MLTKAEEAQLRERERESEERRQRIERLAGMLTAKDTTLAERDAEIARLRRQFVEAVWDGAARAAAAANRLTRAEQRAGR